MERESWGKGEGGGRDNQGGERKEGGRAITDNLSALWTLSNCWLSHLPTFFGRCLRSLLREWRWGEKYYSKQANKQIFMSTEPLLFQLGLLRTKCHFLEKAKHECNSIFNPMCLPSLPLPPANRASEMQHLSNISSEMPDCWDFKEFYLFFLFDI